MFHGVIKTVKYYKLYNRIIFYTKVSLTSLNFTNPQNIENVHQSQFHYELFPLYKIP